MTAHFGRLSRVISPRSRQCRGSTGVGGLSGKGLTLYLSGEGPNGIQTNTMLAEWRNAKRGPDAVVQGISGLDPALSSHCGLLTHQRPRDRPSLSWNSRRCDPHAPYSFLLSLGDSHKKQDSELHTQLGITAVPGRFHGYGVPLPTSPS